MSAPDTARILTCVYCGHEYPQDTPAHGAQILTEHIKVCAKHPMRKAEQDIAILRKALIGLVGVESAEQLDEMDGVIRLMPMPESDRINTLNAIFALRSTIPAP